MPLPICCLQNSRRNHRTHRLFLTVKKKEASFLGLRTIIFPMASQVSVTPSCLPLYPPHSALSASPKLAAFVSWRTMFLSQSLCTCLKLANFYSFFKAHLNRHLLQEPCPDLIPPPSAESPLSGRSHILCILGQHMHKVRRCRTAVSPPLPSWTLLRVNMCLHIFVCTWHMGIW